MQIFELISNFEERKSPAADRAGFKGLLVADIIELLEFRHFRCSDGARLFPLKEVAPPLCFGFVHSEITAAITRHAREMSHIRNADRVLGVHGVIRISDCDWRSVGEAIAPVYQGDERKEHLLMRLFSKIPFVKTEVVFGLYKPASTPDTVMGMFGGVAQTLLQRLGSQEELGAGILIFFLS